MRAALRDISAAFFALIGLCCAGAAFAHFNLNMNVRVIHVEHVGDGLLLYMRTPMPYLVADKTGPIGADGLPKPAPFTTNRLEDGRIVHLVDAEALRADALGLGRIAADGLRLRTGGRNVEPTLLRLRAYPIGQEPGFATLEEAKAALGAGSPFPEGARETYVGDTVVDVLLRYSSSESISEYEISSKLDPGQKGQEETANLILDHGPGDTKVFRVRGLLHEPIKVTRSSYAAAMTFIWEGIRHILGGPDHVLFVLCLVLGATGLRSLIARVTGFTVGHSITLSAGFFGYVPKGAWFVPTVETGIALSIIFAAAIALMPRRERAGREWTMFVVTCAIGLLHGFGFSFVLHEILKVDSPNIWQSLLAFNVGVEIGQLAIVLLTWPLFLLLRKSSETAWRFSRIGLAGACILIATYWSVQRLASLLVLT